MALQRGYPMQVGQTEAGRAALAEPRRCLSSTQLLNGAREMIILHDGCEYVLRLTRQNKLILTK